MCAYPTTGTQVAVVQRVGILDALESTMQTPLHPRVSDRKKYRMKELAITLVSACLEGRKDQEAHELVTHELDPPLTLDFQ